MTEKFNIYLWVSSHGLETVLISEVKAQVDPQSIHRSNCNSESPEVNLGHGSNSDPIIPCYYLTVISYIELRASWAKKLTIFRKIVKL